MDQMNREWVANLERELRQRYALLEERLEIGQLLVDVFVATNIDELLEELIAKGDDHEDVLDERIPYFVDLWPSAIALAAYLESHPEEVKGKSVLEIGCGNGLAGVVAGLLGAASVTLTDYLPEALRFASLVWAKNIPQKAQTAILDWREPDPSLSSPLILAADVAYEARNFQPLIQTFTQLLLPGGHIILTEPSRHIARDFFPMLNEAGFVIDHQHCPVSYKGIEHKVQLHRIYRP
ncbi:MAG: protein N-lysine methyltransferase family protein [Bacteroidia bacterium]|nr:protein N-lysine methyltransferase family protein [Bacteroidia bacterium]